MKNVLRIGIVVALVLSLLVAGTGTAIAVDDPATCDSEGQGDGGTDTGDDFNDTVDEADNNCRDTPEEEAGNSDQ